MMGSLACTPPKTSRVPRMSSLVSSMTTARPSLKPPRYLASGA